VLCLWLKTAQASWFPARAAAADRLAGVVLGTGSSPASSLLRGTEAAEESPTEETGRARERRTRSFRGQA
jgi:hypothetical protein